MPKTPYGGCYVYDKAGNTEIRYFNITDFMNPTVSDILNHSDITSAGITALSATIGGEALSGSTIVKDIRDANTGYAYLYDVTPDPAPSAETITGFYLDGTEYKFSGGGTEYNAGQGISISQENVISNSGVLSVNGQTGAVTIQTGGNYTAGNGIDITNDEIGLDGTYEGEGGKDYSAMRGPAPEGFHVPLTTEWQGVKTIMDGLGLTTGKNWKINLHMPFAGGREFYDASLSFEDSIGYYWSSSPYSAGSSNVRNLELNSSRVRADDNFNRANGFSVRCFKDSFEVPTSSWTVIQGTLGGAGIFWNQSEGLISITDGTTGYTIMDKNLGATTVYNNGDTLTEANMGYMYQWGNNYGFPSKGTISNTSSTQVDASAYGPGNYYSSSTFITGNNDWSSVQNDNLWGGVTGAQPIMISGNLVLGDKLYKIVTSTTAPASGTASNIITIVTD